MNEYGQGGDAGHPTQGKPAKTEHEGASRERDAKGLTAERAVCREIDKRARLKEMPNPLQASQANACISIG